MCQTGYRQRTPSFAISFASQHGKCVVRTTERATLRMLA